MMKELGAKKTWGGIGSGLGDSQAADTNSCYIHDRALGEKCKGQMALP
jgi:hypothetical protein